MLNSLAQMIGLAIGLGVSALFIPGQWGLIFVWGVLMGFVMPWATSRWLPEPPTPAVPEHLEVPAFTPTIMYGIAAVLAGIAAFLLWLLVRDESLSKMQPGLASTGLFVVAMVLGIALFVAAIGRKESDR